MKKLLLILFISLFFTGCATTLIESDRQTYVYGFNFGKFSDKGFMFSPYEYTGNCDSKGLINIHVYPKIRKVLGGKYAVESINKSEWNVVEFGSDDFFMVEKMKSDVALEEAYKVAIKMGGDAIVSFKFDTKSIYQGGVYIGDESIFSGFVIKR